MYNELLSELTKQIVTLQNIVKQLPEAIAAQVEKEKSENLKLAGEKYSDLCIMDIARSVPNMNPFNTNKARAMFGLPPIEGGDVDYVTEKSDTSEGG